MKYFTKLGTEYVPKNKLHKEIQVLFRANDRRVLDSRDQAVKLKKKIEEEIKKLHTRHPKCKEPSLYHGYGIIERTSDLYLSVSGLTSLNFYSEGHE